MAIANSFPAYINSTYLSKFISERGLSLIFAISSFLAIICMMNIPRLIRRFGNIFTIVSLSLLNILALLPLVFSSSTSLILAAFVCYYALSLLIRYALDVYLENFSEDKNTGLIRGVYMTFYNLAWLISPFLSALLVADNGYWKTYGIAALSMIPLITISLVFLTESKKTKDDNHSLWQELKYLWRQKDQDAKSLSNILIIDFFLNFFYAVMVIYMPLYLHEHIGLPWKEIGLAFTIMLLPFVLFELPLGTLADRKTGEKELLLAGTVVIGLSTILASFLQSSNWLIWATLLFLTRVGAATIEMMKETYLFKKIDAADTGILSISRINVPFSYLVGPIFASLIIFVFGFKYIFLFLGLVMLLSLKFACKLKDTK